MDYTVHGILQTRILEWVAFPFSRGSSQRRDQTQVSHIAGRFFSSPCLSPIGGGGGLLTKSCLTFVTPMDCSPPGAFAHGISQARILEWVVIPFSRGIFLTWPRDWTHVSCIAGGFFITEPPVKPLISYYSSPYSLCSSHTDLLTAPESHHICSYLRIFPQRRQWHPTPVLLPGKSHGQMNLVGCSAWGR